MIPGRHHGFDDYLRMARRRKGLIAASFVLVTLTTAAVVSRFNPSHAYTIYSIGLCGGLVVSLALAIFLEHRDTTFRTDDDVFSALAVPVLAVVPAMLTTRERLRRRRRRLALSLTAITAIVASGALIAWAMVK